MVCLPRSFRHTVVVMLELPEEIYQRAITGPQTIRMKCMKVHYEKPMFVSDITILFVLDVALDHLLVAFACF